MHAFTDNANRQWHIVLTIDHMRRVRQACGITLSDLEEGSPPLIERLKRDTCLLVEVVAELIKPQLEGKGVAVQQFEASIDGAALASIHLAFWGEMADFFLPWSSANARMILERILTAEPAGRSSTRSPAP